MIGRRSTRDLAELAFWKFAQARSGHGGSKDPNDYWIHDGDVYEFFYEHDFPANFCNACRRSLNGHHRDFRDFILKLHTGESLREIFGRDEIPPEVSEIEGQIFLRRIAVALLRDFNVAISKHDQAEHASQRADRNRQRSSMAKLLAALELDGYTFRAEQLVHRESAPVDAEKHRGLLIEIASTLGLSKIELLERCLKLSEDGYHNGRWEDCVGNARKAMELTFQECAALWERRIAGRDLAEDVYSRPVKVREYLLNNGLLIEKEQKALAACYGLLSETGSHPNVALNDQARMLRQIALVLSEFVMLRTDHELKAKSK